MSNWKVELDGKERVFEDVRGENIFLKKEFVPIVIELIHQNDSYSAVESSIKAVTSPEGEDVTEFAHYAILYTRNDGSTVGMLFALMEDESSQLVGLEGKDADIESLLEDIFTPEHVKSLALYY